jgi:PAS domain S-box-containing protein
MAGAGGLGRNDVQQIGSSHILLRLGSVIKDISLIGRIEEARRRLEELSTLGNGPPRSEIEVRQAVDAVSGVLDEIKTLVTGAQRVGNSVYENEIPFNVLAEAAADAIISINDQSTILYVNPAAGRMFGYEPGEMAGKNLTCLMPEHLRHIHLASIKRYITKAERHIDWVAVELTGLNKSGQEFPIEVSFAEDIRDGRRFFTGFVRDITGRKRSEEALRESEQRLQDIIDNTTSVIFVKDLELRYLLVNREYERRHDVRREQIRGKTDFDIHPHTVAEAVRANDRRVMEAGEPIQFEESVPSGGSVRHYVVVKFLLRDHGNEPYAICGIATDITALKRTEELQIRRAHQAALRADIHAALSSGGTESALQTILQLTAEAVVRHLDIAFARIWTLNGQRNMLELQASASQYARLEEEHTRVPIGKLGVGLTAKQLRPYVTNDILKDERIEHPEWAKREGMVAFAGYPLIVDRRLVGVLATFARKAFEPDVLEGLASVADTIAQGIERKLAVNQLRESELSLRLFMETIPQMLWSATPDGSIDYCNQRVIDYAGLSIDELRGAGWLKTVHPDDREMMAKVWSSAVSEGVPISSNFAVGVLPTGCTDGAYRTRYHCATRRDAS